MKLYTNQASPFARKCRVIAQELNLKLDEIEVLARDDEALRRFNPLKKIPILILDDGSALFDSAVIAEYLNHLGGGKFFPGMNLWRGTTGRWKALGLQALADGIMEAAVACRYELLCPEAQRNEDFIARYLATVDAALNALERMRFAETPTIGEIATGCALGYLDFRYDHLGWRNGRPKLAAWFETFSQFPSMQATKPS
jgi:glutathione S-transferase